LQPTTNTYIQKAAPLPTYILKWSVLCTAIGLLAGTASALFLESLEWVGHYREAHIWLLALLPLAGLIIGLVYFYLGKGIVSGNNLIIENIHTPTGQRIPLKMAPWVLTTTLLTHLVGGSAGREGTAIQMSGALTDQLTRFIKLTFDDRKILLISSIAAGFASVFGTPLAGALFGLEIFLIGKIRYQALLPALFAALIADYTTQHIWHVGHTSYVIDFVPTLNPTTFVYAIVAGVCFGLTALLFIKSMHALTGIFNSVISYPPIRPLVGGVLLAGLFYGLYTFNGSTKFIGLGIQGIVDAFQHPAESYDFILKLFFTALTLSCGFKGGEVTPLFFIGATLGSALSLVLPLPTALLAGMGFVAVFAGATNTPIACTLMAIELFGSSCGVFVAIACVIAYLCSGHAGIYSAQVIGQSKFEALKKEEDEILSNL
jgi:H+/Cl- antiporter ClcA